MAAFIWPLADHIVTRRFDYMSPVYYQGQHGAIDLIRYGATYGAPVLAIADGTLWANPLDALSGLNCYIDHADGWRSGYRHLSRHVFPYNQPFSVKQGQIIGYAGSTGLSTGPHLHLDLWNKKRQSAEAFVKLGWYAHDPEKYLGIEEEHMGLTQEQEIKLNEMFQKVTDLWNFREQIKNEHAEILKAVKK